MLKHEDINILVLTDAYTFIIILFIDTNINRYPRVFAAQHNIVLMNDFIAVLNLISEKSIIITTNIIQSYMNCHVCSGTELTIKVWFIYCNLCMLSIKHISYICMVSFKECEHFEFSIAASS